LYARREWSIAEPACFNVPMPELPDITVYLEALEARIRGRTLRRAEIRSPFLLRTVEPPVEAAVGLAVVDLRRVGKRIAIGFESDLWLVFHLMIAGRLQWSAAAPRANRRTLAVLEFDSGTLVLTEAGTQRRASLHVVRGKAALALQDPGGLEPLTATRAEFVRAVTRENHTLKRALTDPRILAGIGNAYSDEILHHARLSPLALTHKLSSNELERLHASTRHVLETWTQRLRAETGGGFPAKVTAFREQMAAHGRYGQPCPACGTAIQRIRYATNETNYCPRCQTQGKLLADRSLSRLLKSDWPRTIDELEHARGAKRE
jgi:formamidopyrimidine-DNA glycosylase